MEQILKKETKLQEMTERLEKNLEEYNTQVIPLVRAWTRTRIKKLILIARYIQSVKLSNLNMTLLLNYLFDECDEIQELQIVVEPESMHLQEELDKLRRYTIMLEGEDPDEVLRKEQEVRQQVLNETKQHFIDKLKNLGVEVNFDELHAGLSDEEITILLRKLVFEATSRAKISNLKDSGAQRKKTKKQLEKEEVMKRMDADKDSSLHGMYKKLAKLLHPDTAPDETSRAEKTEWMKQLTAAYQAQDLKTMLRIEMEWLKVESGQIEAMSEEKLSYYNAFLSKQVNELQQQIIILPYNPRFSPMSFFIEEPTKFKSWKLDKVVFEVFENATIEEIIVIDLSSTPAKQKKMIKELIEEQKDLEETRMIYERMGRVM